MNGAIAKADVALASIYKDYRRLSTALVVGVIATLVDTSFLSLLSSYFGVEPMVAKVPSFILGMGVSFYLNRTFTFRNSYDKPHYQFVSFLAIGFTQFVLTWALLGVFVHMIFNSKELIPLMASNIIVAFIGFFYAFTLNKSLTFKIFK